MKARFDYRELLTIYRDKVAPLMGRDAGVLMTDIDERENRILIGVKDPATLSDVRGHLLQADIPPNAVEVIVFDPPQTQIARIGTSARRYPAARFSQSLQSDLSPSVPGGAQIGTTYLSSNYVSTLGFNLMPWINGNPGAQRYLVTCSHCIRPMNQMLSYGVGQPTWSAQFAIEIVDPPAFPGGSGWCCWANKVCRWAEAALARYDDSTEADQGKVAFPGVGSTTFSTRVTIIGMDSPYVGQLVHMIGSQSGRRTGTVAQSCANVTHPSNPQLVMLCQARASYFSVLGDSGSPIIALHAGDIAPGIGIHWGDNGWFSILYQALDELYNASSGSYGLMDPAAP